MSDVATPRAARPRRYGLMALLAVPLVLLGIVVWLNLSNNQLTLTKERLEAARKLWHEAGIKDYDLAITVSGGTSGNYKLQVRDGKVVEGTRDDQPLDARQRTYWTIDSLFDVVLTDDLVNDTKDGGTA